MAACWMNAAAYCGSNCDSQISGSLDLGAVLTFCLTFTIGQVILLLDLAQFLIKGPPALVRGSTRRRDRLQKLRRL